MTVILYIGIEQRSDKKKLMTTLEEYYNKFNEDKRLDSRHGRVEFQTSMHYIHKYLDQIAEETVKTDGEFGYWILVQEQAGTALHWLRKGMM